jgi:nitrite reductase/ring-hydroxylating ferredoxin subunit
VGELIKVATLSEVPPGTARQVDAGGRVVALFNVGGTIYAIGGTCTHRGGPLAEGQLDGTVVTCPLHGAEFDVTSGQVVGPPAEQSVPAYHVVVVGEDISVDVSS